MEYKSPLLNELISILDKRSKAGEQRLEDTIKYVQNYDTSITRKLVTDVDNLNTSINNVADNVTGKLNVSINKINSELSESIRNVSTKVDSSIREIVRNINSSFSSASNSQTLIINGLKDDLEVEISNVDTKYNNLIKNLSTGLNDGLNDLSTRLTGKVNSIDTKYDTSIKNLKDKHDTSFIQLTNLIKDTSTLLDSESKRNISGLQSTVNSRFISVENDYKTKIDSINTSVNNYIDKLNVSINYHNVSIGEVSTRLKREVDNLQNTLNVSTTDIYNKLGVIVTKIDSSLKTLNAKISNQFDASIKDLNTSINTLRRDISTQLITTNTSVNLLDSKQKKIDTSLTNLIREFNDVIHTEKVNGVIDTFREMEDFLNGISDDSTLTGMLKDQKTSIDNHINSSIKEVNDTIDSVRGEINTNVNNRLNSLETQMGETVNKHIVNINSSISDISSKLDASIKQQQEYVNTNITSINSSLNKLNTTITQNVDSSLKSIQAQLDTSLKSVNSSVIGLTSELISTKSRVAKLEAENVVSIQNTQGTNNKTWDDTTNSIYTDTYVVNTLVFDTNVNGKQEQKEVRLVNDNIITEMNKSEKAVTSQLLAINNKLSNIDTSISNVLDTSYVNKKNKYTTNGFNTIGTCLDFIINDMYYTEPVAVSVTYTVSPTSFTRGKNTTVTFTYRVNNYPNNIQSITYNNTTKTEKEFTETVTVNNSVSRALSVVSNYVDSKDAKPASFSKTLTSSANLELYVWTSTSTTFNKTYTASNMPSGYTTYNYSSSNYSINVNNGTAQKYIFFVSDKNLAESKFFVYEHGGSPTLAGGISNLGTITIQKYDVAITYYLYRSNNVLNGNWDIKF